jgi:hypothetical protein
VLKDGGLVGGRIRQESNGYLVEKPGGHFVVPYEMVYFRATDREDAYQKLKATIKKPTAATNLALARWCLTWQLHEHAEEELRAALDLEPDNAEARRMILRLASVLDPDGEPPVLPEPKTDDGFEAQAARSLAGLSEETALLYTTRVQPILVNRCGNAACHGQTGGNPFSLVRVRTGRGSHRIHAERNLAAVLQYVDLKDPQQSRLIALPTSATHGGGEAVFGGAGGAANLETLREWVRMAAADLTGDPSQLQKSPAMIAAEDARIVREYNERPVQETRFSGNPDEPPPPTPEEVARREQLDARRDVLQEALSNERPDAFDPAEFNRRFR